MAVARKIPALTERPTTFCPGCGHGILTRLLGECLTELGQDKNVICSLGVGCSCIFDTAYQGDMLQAPHGRAAAVATGMKMALPDVTVFTYQGDGDAYTIGIAETLNAAYRNENISVFVVNNCNFGMTGGQMSWTTMPGQITATSSRGRDEKVTGMPIKVPEMIASSFSPAYVARGTVIDAKHIMQLKRYIKNALEAQINKEGYSLVEILSPCPTNWHMSPIDAIENIEKNILPYYTVGEFCRRGGERA